jgi:uncharacterized repeat protein (TIGR01451 family)
MLALLLVLSSLAVAEFAQPAQAAPGDCVGTVFRDFNADGVRQADGDPHPNGIDTFEGEPGQAGVTATAYDDTGAVVGTAVTDIDGDFDLSTTLPIGTPIRIEFTWPGLDYLQSGQAGADNDSSVQFADVGSCDLSFAVGNPADYCQESVHLAVPCFVTAFADPALQDAVVSLNFDWGRDTPDPAATQATWADFYKVDSNGASAPPTTLAGPADVGAIWGEAWNRHDGYLYLASYMKATVPFGPGGPGMIYRVPMDPVTGSATGPAEQFFDVATVADVCADPHGPDFNPAPPLITDAVFTAVGRCSLGDIDVSDDGTTLFAVNLTSRELVEIDIASGAVTTTYDYLSADFAKPGCTAPAGDWRPFALEWNDGKLYAGSVCSGETTQDTDDVRAYVHEIDTTGAVRLVLDYRLRDEQSAPVWSTSLAQVAANQYIADEGWAGILAYNPMALTDIDFYNGDMILGYRDMASDGLGNGVSVPEFDAATGAAGQLWYSPSEGDLVCAGYVPGADPLVGTWTHEVGDTCGSRTSTHGHDVNNENPDGAEFYQDGGDTVTLGTRHQEAHLGSTELIPGRPLVQTLTNPAEAIGQDPALLWGYGVAWNDNTDGTVLRAYSLEQGGFATLDGLGKAGGLGDIEALCGLAPLQIGNYVWYDTDGDGVQDPSEAPVVGATVNLYDGAGNLVATTMTGPDGSYYFDVDPNTDYVIRMDNPADYAAGGPLENWSLTQDSADTDDDADSDGVVGADGFPEISYTSGNAGDNDHTLDFGFVAPFDLALQKQLADGTNLGTFAPGDTVTFTLTVENQGAVDATNVELVDYLPAGLTLADAAWTDNGDGTATLNTPLAALAVGASTTVDITFTIDADASGQIDNWAEIAGALDGDGNPVTDIDSVPDSTPGNDNQPTGPNDVTDDETGENGLAGGDEDDHDVAGINVVPEVIVDPPPPTYSLGNQVWFDANNNGIIDPGEEPIEGVWVELFTDADGDGLPDDLNGDGIIDVNDAVATTGTDADGLYLFDGLEPGDYIVGIPPMEWEPGAPLDGFLSSGPTSTDPNDDIDDDDNGTAGPFGYVWSGAVTIGDGEPLGEVTDNDPNTPDANENLTVDFGFYQPVFDLALFKQLADGSNLAEVTIGSEVTYTVTVLNQGSIAAFEPEIVEYTPAGLSLSDPDWADNGDGTASYLLAAVTLAPGESVSVDVTFMVGPEATGTIDNWAEIASVTPVDDVGNAITYPDGSPLTDIDSVPDGVNTDTFTTDDDTTGDGISGSDEDDHDRAQIIINETEARLAFTGLDSTDLTALAFVLMALGAALVVSGRRRDAATL